MPRIALIGAGSIVFTRNLCSDILLTPALQDSTIALMDIDPVRLAQARDLVQAMIDGAAEGAGRSHPRPPRGGEGADYVITTFQQGGLDAYALDIEIPQQVRRRAVRRRHAGAGRRLPRPAHHPRAAGHLRRHGRAGPRCAAAQLRQPHGDQLLGRRAYSGRPHVGLCHSVQGTSEMLAGWIGVPYEEINFLCAGINHQAWFLEFSRGKEDVYPLIWEAIEREEVITRSRCAST